MLVNRFFARVSFASIEAVFSFRRTLGTPHFKVAMVAPRVAPQMSVDHRLTNSNLLLGIECGATRTVALCADMQLKLIRRREAGPGNLPLLSDADLVRHFRQIASQFPRPAAI